MLLASRLSPRWRTIVVRILNLLTGYDVEFVYESKSDAEVDLVRDLARADEVLILTGRGNELQRRAFAPLFLERKAAHGAHVRILLPAIAVGPNNVNWLTQREREVSLFDPSFGDGLLAQQVEANAAFLKPWEDRRDVELRRFNCPHVGRVVVAGRHVYFTPYLKDAHGRDSRVLRFARHSEMGRNLERLVEVLWANSLPD